MESSKQENLTHNKKFESIDSLITRHPDLSKNKDQSILFILVRHRGCTFCRESLDRLQKQVQKIKAQNLFPVVVHMGDQISSELMQEEFNLKDVLFIPDEKKLFYKALSARRGSLSEVLGVNVLTKGVFSGALFKYGIGRLEGDGFQLGGVYLYKKNQTQVLHRPQNAADVENWDLIFSKIV